MRVVCGVQARMGSSRLPGKVLKPIDGKPMIGILLERLSQSARLDEIVVLTSDMPADDPLVEYAVGLGYKVFRGSEADVLDRYYRGLQGRNAEYGVRITGDCPLIDPSVVDEVVDACVVQGVDYASNIAPPTYPDGLDVEVFRMAALESAWRDAKSAAEREHVTPYLRESGRFSTTNVSSKTDESAERWTVDNREDLQVVRAVFEHFAPHRLFSWHDVISLRASRPDIFSPNSALQRNAGMRMGTGQKLWNRAKHVIPGGNMLLSKRAEMFLPEQWPAYFSRAKGCRVWDLDGVELLDMCIMGIGTNILGYGNPVVDEAVREVVDKGNMSTLNCPEEVLLAERLVEMHPWADMVRFARTGGEANAVAIRIARAATGRDKVAFCGYHGWHDWYLSANLGDDAGLDGHLLPGLEPRGVPRPLRGTSIPFSFNRLDELEAILANGDVAAVKMEVSRNFGPAPGFLEGVRQLASRYHAVLIFDECTSGFRETFGGLHLKYGVEPDMAMFGKAMGNGYAITATIGRREVMQAAQTTFISSTFWTERIGPAAALKTLDVMDHMKSWETITETGRTITAGWVDLGRKHGLEVATAGLPALTSFAIASDRWPKYKTLITQEMLKAGILASNAVYVCTEHGDSEIDEYFNRLDAIFTTIAECEAGRSIDDLLEGPVAHTGFRRLN